MILLKQNKSNNYDYKYIHNIYTDGNDYMKL